jgi:hypothetical protein
MDLGGIQGLFYDERIGFVQAQPPVPDRLTGPAVLSDSTAIPSTILVWPGSFGPYLTLRSKTASDR